MVASEFCVGNFVEVYGKITRVNMIGEFGLQTKYGETFSNTKFTNPALKPIPLSEEILLKCGFVKQPTVDFLSKVTFDINSRQQFAWYSTDKVLRFQTIGSGYVMDWNIKYLHQLQNAFFVVTQKELEIEL